jgi:uncharacterized phiE125 gp8 family phage protein
MQLIEFYSSASNVYLSTFEQVPDEQYPPIDPIDFDTVKLYTRVDGDSEDMLLKGLLKAATNLCQTYTWLQFMPAKFKAATDKFYDVIYITKNPVKEIVSIKYYDKDNVQQTLPTSDYSFANVNGLGTIKLKKKQPTYERLDAVEVIFVAGFGGREDVPEEAKVAIMMTVSNMYENRQDTFVGTMTSQLPMGSQYILDSIKIKTI